MDEEIEKIAKDNGIEIPRLSGYRLMKDQIPVTRKEIKEIEKDAEIYIVERLCKSEKFWNPNCPVSCLCEETRRKKDLLLIKY